MGGGIGTTAGLVSLKDSRLEGRYSSGQMKVAMGSPGSPGLEHTTLFISS